VIADIEQERAEASAKGIDSGTIAIGHDVRKADSAKALVEKTKDARMLFQAAPSGHGDYLEELAAILKAANGRPDPSAVADLRRPYDIEQLTILRTRSN
jgi:hypothetical protein